MKLLPDRPWRWLLIGIATALVTGASRAAGIPSEALFAGLVVGLVYALASRVPLAPARPTIVAAQVGIGIALGAYFQLGPLLSLGGRWIAVALAVLGTLAASLAAGLLVSALTGLDRPTALLGLVAGGAAGIVTMSDELGADARLVAFMQYVRVFVVVASAPLLVVLLLDEGSSGGALADREAGVLADLGFTFVACAGGLALARVVRVPAASLLAPMAVAAALTLSGVAAGAELPRLLQDVAFAVIGLQVGLRFTRATLRHARRLLTAVLAGVIAVILACAGLAALLAVLAGVSFLDAYLATTPGGIYAVLATAVDSGADPSFVLAVQALRLVVMVAAAPPLVRLLAARE